MLLTCELYQSCVCEHVLTAKTVNPGKLCVTTRIQNLRVNGYSLVPLLNPQLLWCDLEMAYVVGFQSPIKNKLNRAGTTGRFLALK